MQTRGGAAAQAATNVLAHSPVSRNRLFALGLIVALGVMVMVAWGQLFVHVDSRNIVVVQYPITGTLTAFTRPGTYFRLGGSVTEYPRRKEYSFSAAPDQGKAHDQSLAVRFNDGGQARISGVISWEMPTVPDRLLRLHQEFRSEEGIEQQLVRPAIERAIYFTGPLMSSTDSFAARRSDFLKYFEDQLKEGIYQTRTFARKEPDPITKVEKTVIIAEIMMEGAVPKRQGASPLSQFGINVLPPSINRIKYDDAVENQINQQRDATMQVEIAQAKAREAEQKAITSEKEGQALAAIQKWQQEAIKAKAVVAAEQEKEVAVTKANQQLQVATLDAQAAEQTKRRDILLGEGEAQRRTLVMSADGALTQKLEAYVKVNEMYAHAMANYKGNWVPGIQMGQSTTGASGGNGAQALIDILSAKAARDLALDLAVTGTPVTPAPAKR